MFSYLQKRWITAPMYQRSIFLLAIAFAFLYCVDFFLSSDHSVFPTNFVDLCSYVSVFIAICVASVFLGYVFNAVKHFLWASNLEKGKNYYTGAFSKPNYDKAVEHFRKAAEKGNAEAQYYLGCCYRDGQGVLHDSKEAVRWFRPAAERGEAKAQCELGCCYEDGAGVPKDYEEAVKWYRKAAEQLDFYVAQTKNERKGLYKVLPAVYALGRCYEEGHGVPKDIDEAEKWYRKAARFGYRDAQERLKELWGFNTSISREYAKSEIISQKKWKPVYYLVVPIVLVILCVGGNNWLGYYYFGKGYDYDKEQNYEEALKWYHRAADRGYVLAYCNIGCCYEGGYGVPQDYEEAVKWYRKGAEKGDAMAQNNLGCCYEEGNGVPQDYEEAVMWYRKAAEQGNSYGYKNLGDCYEEGHGVPKDAVEAMKFYRKAARLGNEKAKEKLEELAEEMLTSSSEADSDCQ